MLSFSAWVIWWAGSCGPWYAPQPLRADTATSAEVTAVYELRVDLMLAKTSRLEPLQAMCRAAFVTLSNDADCSMLCQPSDLTKPATRALPPGPASALVC